MIWDTSNYFENLDFIYFSTVSFCQILFFNWQGEQLHQFLLSTQGLSASGQEEPSITAKFL